MSLDFIKNYRQGKFSIIYQIYADISIYCEFLLYFRLKVFGTGPN